LSILSKTLCVLCVLCGSTVTAIVRKDFFLFAAGAEIKIGVLKKRLTSESAENAEMKEIKKNTF